MAACGSGRHRHRHTRFPVAISCLLPIMCTCVRAHLPACPPSTCSAAKPGSWRGQGGPPEGGRDALGRSHRFASDGSKCQRSCWKMVEMRRESLITVVEEEEQSGGTFKVPRRSFTSYISVVTQMPWTRSESVSSSRLLEDQFWISPTWNDLYFPPHTERSVKRAREVGRTSITEGVCAEAAFKHSCCHVSLSHEQRAAVSYGLSPLTADTASGTIKTTLIRARSSIYTSQSWHYLTAAQCDCWGQRVWTMLQLQHGDAAHKTPQTSSVDSLRPPGPQWLYTQKIVS